MRVDEVLEPHRLHHPTAALDQVAPSTTTTSARRFEGGALGAVHGDGVSVSQSILGRGALGEPRAAAVVEDGGGRELAYVGLSRARHRSTIYVEADFLDQAVDDLTGAWAVERRQQWVTDRETIATPSRAIARTDDLGVDLW